MANVAAAVTLLEMFSPLSSAWAFLPLRVLRASTISLARAWNLSAHSFRAGASKSEMSWVKS